MTRHVDAMDAVGYWREVVTTFYFDKPGDQIAGTILELVSTRGKPDPPTIKIQTKDGDVWIIPAHQARLRYELKRARPAVGDRIRITYNGEATKAPAGLSPTKDFAVEVRRPASQPPAGTEKPGEASENGSEVGK